MKTFGISVIGLGSIGCRMLRAIEAHPRFRCVGAWDPSPAACERALGQNDALPLTTTAAAAIGSTLADLVYVACPPAGHLVHVQAALDAGKAILCEKPLGVDLDQSERLARSVERSGLPAAVNLVYGSARNARELGDRLTAGSLGEVVWVDISLHLAGWASRRLAEAPWLAGRSEGGFVREVTTHYLFLCRRLLGDLIVQSAEVRYPDDGVGAERFVDVRLDASGIPVSLTGTTLGVGPEVNTVTVWGTAHSCRIRDLHHLDVAGEGGWVPAWPPPGDAEQDTYRRQLDNLASMLTGQPHTLASFEEALETQRLVEAILRG